MMVIFDDIRIAADDARQQLDRLTDKIDAHEALANTTSSQATLLKVRYDLRILRRDIERLGEILEKAA